MTPNDAVPAANPDFNEWAIYARVSTEDQAEKYSLPSQMRAIREKVAKIGGIIPDNLVFVDSCTGKDTNRPELQKLRQLIEAKAIKGIGIYTLDRLSRDVLDAVHYHRLCKSKGIRLEFVNLTIDDSPQGEFMYTLLAAVAQLERRTIIERSNRGRREKAMGGHLTNGSAPFGYKYIGKKDGSRGSMEINEEQAATVRQIFRWAREGMSLYRIKETLNAQGIRSARAGRAKSKKEAARSGSPNDNVWAGLWSRQTVHQLLNNKAYIGESVFSLWINRELPMGQGGNRQIGIPCRAIIDLNTWHAVQVQLERNSKARAGRPSRNYLLTGLLWCERCKHRFTTKPHHGHALYVCGHTNKFQFAQLCPASGIGQSLIENAVWEAIWDAMSNPQILEQWARAYYDSMVDAGSRANLEHTIKKLQRREQRAMEILMDPDSLVPYAKAKAQVESVRSELSVTRAELAAASTVQMPSKAVIEELCNKFRKGRDLTSFAHKRELLQRVVQSIHYDDRTREITIKGLIRFGAAANNSDPGIGGTPDKNCLRTVNRDDNSFACIPFILKRRVA